ncbi:MotA/TolQ/ExbB proton channel family protein [Maricaulis sp.]|uniref:MotA/TolQ/ExbB proton channel family protein n=1 Tax=Maricaulis sp. TaxID=1486257 RepID=UPI003A90C3FC
MMDLVPVWLVQGGWVIWILAVGSVVSIAAIIYVFTRHAAARLALSPRRTEALLETVLGPEGGIARTPYEILAATAGKLRRAGTPRQEILDELTILATEQLNDLRTGMRLLEVIAGAAPLMGLLGTVLGMIEAFKQLEMGGSQIDPSVLSGGIWQALLTTAAGLIVALPALIAWHHFDRGLENARIAMNALLARISNALRAADHAGSGS